MICPVYGIPRQILLNKVTEGDEEFANLEGDVLKFN